MGEYSRTLAPGHKVPPVHDVLKDLGEDKLTTLLLDLQWAESHLLTRQEGMPQCHQYANEIAAFSIDVQDALVGLEIHRMLMKGNRPPQVLSSYQIQYCTQLLDYLQYQITAYSSDFGFATQPASIDVLDFTQLSLA